MPTDPSCDGLPLVEPLLPHRSAASVFRRLACHAHCAFLDSALSLPALGRWSFVAADPVAWLEAPAGSHRPLAPLADALRRWPTPAVPGLPPFQGGWIALFGYELGRSFETLPRVPWDEFALPALAAGLYDVVIAFDHQADRGWVFSQGLPEVGRERRCRRAAERMRQTLAWLEGDAGGLSTHAPPVRPPIGRDELAPQYPVGRRLTSNFSPEGYLRAVAEAKELIAAGDVYQVNLSQRLLHPADDDPLALYLRLRERNPAPFAAYFDLGSYQLLSASPERFLRLDRRRVETRPIKGTRRRTGDVETDARLAAELRQCEKDRAENVMIVDLLRNDLGRVCRPGSVRVTEVCSLETYAHVMHLVSAIEGELRDGCGPLDLLRASVPGGSVTGAPKIRAMEIIAQLEPTARGAYCGSLGYVGLDGSMDTNILIRTVTAGRGWWQIPVGGGVVADSDPRHEYQETWDKAEGLLRALE